MELTEDLVAVQGILINVMKTTGEFKKINYRGGNEEKISKIIEQIQKHISGKDYIKNGKINSVVDKQLEDIVFFLAINTKYKQPLDLTNYEHLIDIMPQLSKCVLANIVFNLDLCKYYCKVIEKFPVNCGIELLEEIIPCLEKSAPEIQLRHTIILLRAAVNTLSADENLEMDGCDVLKLTEVTNIILKLLTGFYMSNVQNLKAVQIHQHMGYSLLSLLELLLYCNKENSNLKQFIKNVVRTSFNIFQNVTIDVFCSWAEINEGEESLQSVIANKAYQVKEEYQTYGEAKALVSILSEIAKRPKTLSERIQAADVTTMIKKVSIKDKDQKAWFKAVLGTQVFNNKDAMKCVRTWAHLCDKDDVVRLMTLSYQTGVNEAKQLAVKCASTLCLQDLIIIMTRCFYQYKFNELEIDSERIEHEMKLIFGKINSQTNFIKDMCLLMLQSPITVLKGIYGECIRTKCYTMCYKELFATIKEIVNINDFCIVPLWQAMLCNRPDPNNVDNYVTLLSTLQEIDYLPSDKIINDLLLALLKLYQPDKEFEQLGCILQVFLGCSIKIPAISEMTEVRWTLLNIINGCRCTFLELNVAKQQTANYAVDVIKILCEVHPSYDFESEPSTSAASVECNDEFTNYYIKYLSSKTDRSLLRTLYSDFSTENYGDCISRVLKFLPRAVTSEWLSIMQEIFFLCGSDKAMEILTDVMILLCHVIHTQDLNSNTSRQMVVALKYCMQQYGNGLRKIQLVSTEAMEVNITKQVCRLLKHLPEEVKEEEGLSIINVFTQRSLKSLEDDRAFACLLSTINNSRISRTLVHRMTH